MSGFSYRSKGTSYLGSEPHVRIFRGELEVGIMVFDDDEGCWDIWIAVEKNERVVEGTITWKWLHLRETPLLLEKAKQHADSLYEKILNQYIFHSFP